MRTRAEVRAFLESKVNTRVNDKLNSDLNGQCVTLIKALMEFLGVANPYAGRGNAKDAGDTYIRQGIGTEGGGWLTVCVSRVMGVVGGTTYGHIWFDISGEANYEQNGARALTVTKNTRPISQAQQFINFDKWIKAEQGDQDMATDKQIDETVSLLSQLVYGKPAPDAIFKDWRNLIKNNPNNSLEGLLGILKGSDTNPEALKNQKVAAQTDMVEVGNNTGLFQRKK